MEVLVLQQITYRHWQRKRLRSKVLYCSVVLLFICIGWAGNAFIVYMGRASYEQAYEKSRSAVWQTVAPRIVFGTGNNNSNNKEALKSLLNK
jgi:hypothetical protein